jgi:hypothetical protein
MFSKKDFLVRLRMMAVAGFLVIVVWQSASHAAWTQINIPGTTSINYVAVADSVVFAAANKDSMVFRSTDHGATWQKVTGLKGFCKLLGNNTNLFASADYLSSSSDRGITWSKVNTLNSVFNSGIWDISVQDNKILITQVLRPFFSGNNGQSWEIINSGYNSSSRFCLVMGNILFLGGGSGLYSSQNLGHTWNESNYGIYNFGLINRIMSTSKYLYASLRRSDGQTGVYCSTDSGYTWKSMGFQPKNYYCSINDISFSKTTAFVGTDSGVYAAPLDSANWTDISMSSKLSISSLATDTGYLYATTIDYDADPLIYSLFRRPLSEVNAQLKKQVAGPQPLTSNNFVIDHFTSQHAFGITLNPGRTEKASLKVYSATGKAVATLFDGTMHYGTNKFTWDYKTMPSGIYCISLQSENGKAVKKVQVMK